DLYPFESIETGGRLGLGGGWPDDPLRAAGYEDAVSHTHDAGAFGRRRIVRAFPHRLDRAATAAGIGAGRAALVDRSQSYSLLVAAAVAGRFPRGSHVRGAGGAGEGRGAHRLSRGNTGSWRALALG